MVDGGFYSVFCKTDHEVNGKTQEKFLALLLKRIWKASALVKKKQDGDQGQ